MANWYFTSCGQASAAGEKSNVRGEGGRGEAAAEADPHAARQGGEQGPRPCQWPQHQLGGREYNVIEYLFCVTIDFYFL